MMRSKMSAEHTRAFDKVLSRPTNKIILLGIKQDPNDIKNELNELIQFIKQYSSSFGNHNFAFKLFSDGTPLESKLTVKYILSRIELGEELINLSNGLLPVGSDEIDLSPVSISEASEGNIIIYVEHGQYVSIWVNEALAADFNVFYPKSNSRSSTKFCRPAEDYPLLVLDHYRQHVKYGQAIDLWHDRVKRILRCVPCNTEFIFHKSLWNWLEDHKMGFFVYGEVGKLSPDRTDIELVTTKGKGKRYILEIKWLGKNENGTEYKEDRIGKGIKQIDEYLKRDPNTLIASLIIYNGRPMTNFSNLITKSICSDEDWCQLDKWDEKIVPDRGTCFVFYLNSETASTAR